MDEGDKVRVDFDKGEIVNETKNKTYKHLPSLLLSRPLYKMAD